MPYPYLPFKFHRTQLRLSASWLDLEDSSNRLCTYYLTACFILKGRETATDTERESSRSLYVRAGIGLCQGCIRSPVGVSCNWCVWEWFAHVSILHNIKILLLLTMIERKITTFQKINVNFLVSHTWSQKSSWYLWRNIRIQRDSEFREFRIHRWKFLHTLKSLCGWTWI